MSSSKRKIEKISSSTSLDDVFEYMGKGQTVPKDVVSVRFHPSVVDVDSEAFRNCKHLREVMLNEGLREFAAQGLTNIEGRAFYGCSTLQSINIPSTVTKISEYTFAGCSSLIEVVLNDGLTAIGYRSFVGCSLQCIAVPSTVSEISTEAFRDCSSLSEVVLSDGLKKIGNGVFQDCTSIQNITIPSSVNVIDYNAFRSCTNLREVVLKDGINKIKEGAFGRCTSLTSIAIPSKVIEIGSYAFDNCTNLREVVIHNEGVQIGDKAFLRCTSLERFKFLSLSTRLGNIQAGQRDIETKMDNISAVEWRGGELSIPAIREQKERPWGIVETLVKVNKEKLDKIMGLITYYEIKEATTLFELALWKAKIDQADISNPTDRAVCRIEVPGPVKDTILQYLN